MPFIIRVNKAKLSRHIRSGSLAAACRGPPRLSFCRSVIIMFSFLLYTTISIQCKEWNEFCISCMYIHATALLETGQPALHFQGGGGGQLFQSGGRGVQCRNIARIL